MEKQAVLKPNDSILIPACTFMNEAIKETVNLCFENIELIRLKWSSYEKISVAEYKIIPILNSNTRTTWHLAYALLTQMIDGEMFANEKLTAGLISYSGNGYLLFICHTDDKIIMKIYWCI